MYLGHTCGFGVLTRYNPTNASENLVWKDLFKQHYYQNKGFKTTGWMNEWVDLTWELSHTVHSSVNFKQGKIVSTFGLFFVHKRTLSIKSQITH